MLKKIFIFNLLIVNFLLSQQGTFRDQDLGNPDFQNEFISFKSKDTTLTRVDVYVQIPYDNLRFVKHGQTFTARFEVIAIFFDLKDNVVLEKSWDEEIITNSISPTGAKTFKLSQRSFEVFPGKYKTEIKLRDYETGKIAVKKNQLVVRNYISNKIEISDLMYLNRVREENGKKTLSPNLSSNLTEMEFGLQFFYEVYIKNCDDSLTLRIKTRGKDEKTIQEQTEKISCKIGTIQGIVKMENAQLPIGEYVLEFSVETKKDSAKISKKLISRHGSSSIIIKDVDLAIRQLKYISKDDEYKNLTERNITEEEKLKRFNDFWKKRDPNQDTEVNEYFEEYYYRVEYANKHFAHYSDGWRTDMGMVFIIFGMPNNIERHPFEMNSKPYEIWTYYEFNRQLVFVDETGFGDYRLVTPIWDLLHRLK